jgi:ABC-type Zn uptake system ZnuABC Zn-binding protein ZnuA
MKMIFNFNSLRNANFLGILVLGLAFLLLAGCGQPEGPAPESDRKLQVMATTTLVADVVKNIGGDRIEVETLLPVGTDPHSFTPTPRDLARLAEAEVIFVSGAGLEEFLLPLIESANPQARLVDVSAGIELMAPPAGDAEHADEAGQTEGDPHVWTDPKLVMVWAHNIARALGELDPTATAAYLANAEGYRQQLQDLDTWIRRQVAAVPPENRRLVTDHQVLGYFAREYGFEQVGAILPGFSTVTEPTAQELAALQAAIQAYGVKAILVGKTINPSLAQQLSQDTGIRLVSIYTGSLSEADGPAGNFLDYMRYNVAAIVDALN